MWLTPKAPFPRKPKEDYLFPPLNQASWIWQPLRSPLRPLRLRSKDPRTTHSPRRRTRRRSSRRNSHSTLNVWSAGINPVANTMASLLARGAKASSNGAYDGTSLTHAVPTGIVQSTNTTAISVSTAASKNALKSAWDGKPCKGDGCHPHSHTTVSSPWQMETHSTAIPTYPDISLSCWERSPTRRPGMAVNACNPTT